MAAPTELSVEARAGGAMELLIGVSTLTAADRDPAAETWVPLLDDCSAALRQAVDRVGARSGKLWLHLLGLALEADDARELLTRVEALDGRELRRHLVGVHVPTWRDLIGAEKLERAASGDARAIRALLTHPRYYGGEADDALSRLLPLAPAQTKRRVLAVLRRFAGEVFEPIGRKGVAALEGESRRIEQLGRSLDPEAVISAATGGYEYEREPEFTRVVLVPHVAARPWLLLCQHADTRIVCYPLRPDAADDLAARGVRLGRALGDEQRIRILRRLVAGDASLAELAEGAGIAKSTAHHHLALLREAGLVTLHGNARRYWYALRRDGLAEVGSLVAELLTTR